MLAIVVAIVLTLCSLIQLIWMVRVVRRMSVAWGLERGSKANDVTSLASSDDDVPVSANFESLCGFAPVFWVVGFLATAAVYLEDALGAQPHVERISLMLAMMLWSAVLFVISRSVRQILQMRLSVSLPADIPAEIAETWRPPADAAERVPTREEFLRSLARTQRMLTIVMWFALLVLGLPCVAGLMAAVIEFVDAGFGSLLALMATIIGPAWGIYSVVSIIVNQRARQTQLLWFLATTVKHQRPLAAELKLWADAQSGLYCERLRAVASEMQDGLSLADALDVVGGLVPPSALVSLHVAEQTGMLAVSLRSAAERYTESLKAGPVSNAVFGAGTYLWLLLAFGSAVSAYLMYFIVPKYKAIFQGFGTEIPALTTFVFEIVSSLATWPALLVAIFGLTGVIVLLGEAAWRGWSDSRLAWWVGVGRRLEAPSLLRRLRLAVVAQVPLDAALRPMVLSHPWPDARRRLERVLGRVTAGANCWHALRDVRLLNSRDLTLIETAERAGNLGWVLSALADAKERRFVHRWRMAISVVVPLTTLAAGLFVMLICLSFFLPLAKLINDLG